MQVVAAIALAISIPACSTKDPLYCQSSADCEDPALPICDVHGDFAESNHIANTCIARPDNCPVETCGCAPGTFLGCALDEAQTCGADGMSTVTQACAQGCSSEAGGCRCTTGDSVCAADAVSTCNASGVFDAPVACPLRCADDTRCTDISASNGLNAALDAAADRQAVTLGDGAVFDTSTGVVIDGNAASVVIPSVLVPQPNGAPPIRAFLAKSMILGNARAKGANAFAIVADGVIELHGVLDAGAAGSDPGPGANTALACAGTATMLTYDQSAGEWGDGAGGAGHSTAGGSGGPGAATGTGPAGGAAAGVPQAEPLVGGCEGGDVVFHTGAVGYNGGHGGGAVQLVSRVAIRLTRTGASAGAIDVGGSGGSNTGAGGGAGGTVLVESPEVLSDGAGTGFFANGGGGGGCGLEGADGTASVDAAAGRSCNCGASGGDGGTGLLAPEPGERRTPAVPPMVCPFLYKQGGGGGAAGRVRINTQTGTFAATNGGAISAASSVGTIGTR
ncbi:MAG: hypothetical protein K8W52_03760 [Deltaproteobacteria bacterium]|nr:hypothetical protein [Deltaproteobacteria bacterium]